MCVCVYCVEYIYTPKYAALLSTKMIIFRKYRCENAQSVTIVCHTSELDRTETIILTIAGGVMCKNRKQLSISEFKST